MTARIAVQLDGDLLGILICFHRLNQKSRHFYDRYRVEIEKDTRISTFLYFNTKLIYVIFVSIRSAALGKEQVEKLGLLLDEMSRKAFIKTLKSRSEFAAATLEIIKKDLRPEALRLKAEQAQQPQGHVALNLTREDSRRRKQEKVWSLLKVCDNTNSS